MILTPKMGLDQQVGAQIYTSCLDAGLLLSSLLKSRLQVGQGQLLDFRLGKFDLTRPPWRGGL